MSTGISKPSDRLMSMTIPLPGLLGLVAPLVFCACYETSGRQLDILEYGDGEPEHAVDDGFAEQEDVPQEQDADGDPVPECRFSIVEENRQITFYSAFGEQARSARLVYTGSEYGLFWNDSRGDPQRPVLSFTRLSLEGEKLADDIWLQDLEPALGYAVFSGSDYAIAYGRMIGDHLSHELHFTRISLEGRVTQDAIVMTNTRPDFEMPYIVFTGSGYALVWTSNVEGVEDRDFNINLLLLDLEGMVLGDVKKLVEGPWDSYAERTETVFTGSEFALLWHSLRSAAPGVSLAMFSQDGTPLGEPTTVFSAPGSSHPHLAYGGGTYGALFAAEYPAPPEMAIILALLSEEGELQGDYIEVVSGLPEYSLAKELVYGKGGFCTAWLNAGDERIYGVLVGNDGTVTAPEAPLTPEGVNSTDTFSIVSAGDEYALVWSSDSNLYFGRAGCL
jgi:hypothetical protein